MSNKLIIIGLDGATLDLIRPWADEGKLPNFKEIMENGSWGPLKSTTPPVTAPAWPAMYTGKNPGKLGLFYFEKEQKGTYEPLIGHASEYDGKNIWEILTEAGIRCGLINCPMTYPPYPVKGFMITNAPSVDSEYVYPKELMNEISGMYQPKNKNFYGCPTDEYLDDLFGMEKKKTATAKHLMKNKDWDLFFFTIISTDTVQHFFFKHMFEGIVSKDDKKKYGDVILDVYRLADDFLGFAKKMGHNMLIVSDHGAGFWNTSKPARVFYANSWLTSIGLLKEKKGAQAISFASKMGLSPERIYRIALKLGIDLRRHISKETQDRIIKPVNSIDYPKTKAWLRMNFSDFGGFRINLEDREPSGVVKRSEYDEFRDDMIKKLEELKDPETEKTVMKHVWKRETLYHGPHVDSAPDIMFEMEENYTSMRMIAARPFDEMKNLSGFHKMNGILLAYGPDIAKGKKIENASILDITPTALHTFGIPIPEDMDGKVLREIFDTNSKLFTKESKIGNISKTKQKRISTITKEDEESIKKGLKDLGYI